MLSFEQKLQNYAELTVKVGVGLQAGQRLLVRAPVEAASLVRLIVASAYRAGARLVDVMWLDDALTLARFQYAPRDSFEEYPAWRTETMAKLAKQGDASLAIHAVDPDLLKDQDPELVALAQRIHDEHMLPFRRQIMADATNWCLISLPVAGWAAKIFPNDPPDEQMSKLWEIIFKVCRIDRPDPMAAWQEHLTTLKAKTDYLNAKHYTALKYTAPGTDFTVGLPANHLWKSGQSVSQHSIVFVVNIPTEEIFTMPHRDKAEGVVSSAKPLSHAGILIEDFSLTFENGRITKVTAKKGEAVLKKLIESDEGAARLGEVALVPHSSPISQSGLLFYNTLYDENAANHLALGRAYRCSLKNGLLMSDEEFAKAGGNDSLIHVDFMIGSAHMDVDGITSDGAIEPIMRAGEWTF
ncbi:MAG: aminopeptidase [Anaerolineae bacterium]|nr:aminopeptidase [Anaerolineae bacterium]